MTKVLHMVDYDQIEFPKPRLVTEEERKKFEENSKDKKSSKAKPPKEALT